jgi:hypothetical protein
VAAEAVLETHVLESHELVFVDLLATVASKNGGSTRSDSMPERR